MTTSVGLDLKVLEYLAKRCVPCPPEHKEAPGDGDGGPWKA